MEVTGVDRSASFLQLARENAAASAIPATFVEGDLRRLPVDGPFDAVVCWFTSFGYFDDADNLATLMEFRRVLGPGGVLVLDTLSHDGYVRGFTEAPEAVVVEVDGNLMVDRNTFDPTTGRVHTVREIVRDGSRRTVRFAIRLLTVPEWHDALSRAGFASVEVTDRGGDPLEVSTWRLVVTAVA
jgi:SAM-dependent methyltransferase